MALLSALGVLAGGLIAIQSVLNSALGQRTGTLGSVLLLTLVSVASLVVLIVLFPKTADFQRMPGPSEWYLYVGGLLGVAIVASPIILIPRIGAAATLSAIVLGQLLFAVVIDHFALLSTPKTEADLPRILGIGLVVLGALLVSK
jgi:transporter family-2 protein